MEETIKAIQGLGQSIWIDYMRRGILATGELGELVRRGVTGLTSNPTIFEKAISESTDYDSALSELSTSERAPSEIFEQLAVEDIQGAADILRSVYDDSDGADGFASLELPPPLANDTKSTITEARRMFRRLDRPNVMIKVPATASGVAAVRPLIAEGINVNVTLIFAVTTYQNVMYQYIEGLEDRAKSGKNLGTVSSVASFFVSRIDTAVDAELRSNPNIKTGNTLVGTAAIANAQNAYALFQHVFSSDRFLDLSKDRGRVQRPLWASTSTKDPMFRDTLYVDELIGQNTVNTVPPDTLEALCDHGVPLPRLARTESQGAQQMRKLESASIDMTAITDRLLQQGMMAFSKSYDLALESIQSKMLKIRSQ